MSTKMNTKKSTKTTPVVDTPVIDTPVTSAGSNVVSSLLTPSSSFTALLPRDLVSEFMALSPEQRLAIWDLIRPTADETPVKPAKVLKTKAEPKPKKEKAAPAPLPVPDDGSVPTAASYRVNPAEIDHSVCVGRMLDDGEDKRWKPSVYREHQCGKSVEDGSDLCSGCSKRSEKAAETGKHGAWNGRVTEEAPSWCHMLGTAWAAKCKWNPDGASVSDSASVASDHSSTADKMNAAAAKKEAADAKKAAAAAEKAKKAEEKAAADAKKKEEKEAAAAAKKAKTPAKPKKEAAAVSTSNAVADTTAPVATADGELEIIGHTMYWVRSGNVYEYDEESKAAGSFVGRKNEDGSIDEDADEEVDAESDSE